MMSSFLREAGPAVFLAMLTLTGRSQSRADPFRSRVSQ